jgi:hypothetical protein
MLFRGFDAFFPASPALLIEHNAIVRVVEDDSFVLPIWMPLKWTVETMRDRHTFSFGVLSKGKRTRWLRAIALWASQ